MNLLGLSGDKGEYPFYTADFDNRYFSFSSDRHGSQNYWTRRLELCGVGRAYKNVKHAAVGFFLFCRFRWNHESHGCLPSTAGPWKWTLEWIWESESIFHNPFKSSPCHSNVSIHLINVFVYRSHYLISFPSAFSFRSSILPVKRLIE